MGYNDLCPDVLRNRPCTIVNFSDPKVSFKWGRNHCDIPRMSCTLCRSGSISFRHRHIVANLHNPLDSHGILCIIGKPYRSVNGSYAEPSQPPHSCHTCSPAVAIKQCSSFYEKPREAVAAIAMAERRGRSPGPRGSRPCPPGSGPTAPLPMPVSGPSGKRLPPPPPPPPGSSASSSSQPIGALGRSIPKPQVPCPTRSMTKSLPKAVSAPTPSPPNPAPRRRWGPLGVSTDSAVKPFNAFGLQAQDKPDLISGLGKVGFQSDKWGKSGVSPSQTPDTHGQSASSSSAAAPAATPSQSSVTEPQDSMPDSRGDGRRTRTELNKMDLNDIISNSVFHECTAIGDSRFNMSKMDDKLYDEHLRDIFDCPIAIQTIPP